MAEHSPKPMLTVVPGVKPVKLTLGVVLLKTNGTQLTVQVESTTVKTYCTRTNKARQQEHVM